MIAALFYLQYHSTRNRLVTRFKRLKQPKYLIGAIAGGLYFYFYFYRYLFALGKWPAVDAVISRFRRNIWRSSNRWRRAGLFRHRAAGVADSARTRRAHVYRSRGGVSFSRARQPPHADSFQTHPVPVADFIQRPVFHVVFPALWRQCLDSRRRLVADSLHPKPPFLGASFARTLLLDHGISNRLRRLLAFALVIGLWPAVVWYWAKNTLPAEDLTPQRDFDSIAELCAATC